MRSLWWETGESTGAADVMVINGNEEPPLSHHTSDKPSENSEWQFHWDVTKVDTYNLFYFAANVNDQLQLNDSTAAINIHI